MYTNNYKLYCTIIDNILVMKSNKINFKIYVV